MKWYGNIPVAEVSQITRMIFVAFDLILWCLCVFQSVAELEQKWQNEVDEAQQGKLENNTPFFHDYHFFEVRKS